jgi:hypothetical protein
MGKDTAALEDQLRELRERNSRFVASLLSRTLHHLPFLFFVSALLTFFFFSCDRHLIFPSKSMMMRESHQREEQIKAQYLAEIRALQVRCWPWPSVRG